ncbi:hypothetical protein QBC40DRAFT_321480 [Triangularia verruculosa]|uniref:Uncharacterized protein n=1 Tax=Triangularia verruculosa TaxID=2587418 RepID=A0AAN7AXZ4_9PEZI|nr:hypothetical protein QBC40DRAFT_321480 [Triangularia verruculosa]
MDDSLQTFGFDLGGILATTQHSDLSVILSCSCSLSLPDYYWDIDPDAIDDRHHVPSIFELFEASSRGDIWIAKAGGGCELEFSTFVDGTPLGNLRLKPDTELAIAHLASGCGIWQELGLDLRLKHASGTEPEIEELKAVYFLHHPDLSSSLVAPPELPVASFQALKVEIDFRISMPDEKDGSTRPTKEGKLGLEDRMEEALTLLNIAITKMIGVKKSTPGVKVTKTNPDLPLLIDIAPGVWNLQYLQSMTAHAQMIPSLASSIARLKYARSASLRKKVASLRSGSINPEIWDSQEEIEGEIRRRLWLRCQTSIRPDPIKKTKATQRGLQDTTQAEASRNHLGGQELLEGIDEPLGNPRKHAQIMNAVTKYCDIPEGIYEDVDDDEEEDDDGSCSESDSLPPFTSSDIGAINSSDWQGSSEAEYFYADGHGNVISLPRNSETEQSEQEGWDRSSSFDAVDSDHDTYPLKAFQEGV